MIDLADEAQASDIADLSARLCDAFEKIRHVRDVPLEDAAAACGLTPRQLRAIECGSFHPSPDLIKQIAEFYRIDADRLGTDVMIQRTDPGIDPEACIIWFGWLPIEYGSNFASNRSILDAVADGIRLLRSADATSPVIMRANELDLVLTLLDLTADDLTADAVRAFRLPWKKTEQLISESKARVRTKSLVMRARNIVALQAT